MTSQDKVELLPVEEAAIRLNMRATTLTRFCGEGRVDSTTTGDGLYVPVIEVERIITERERIGQQLAKARADAATRVGESIAADLGLDAATAKRLGLT